MAFSTKLTDLVSSLLSKQDFSDIIIFLEDGHKISAHKLVLFVRNRSWRLDDFINAEYLDLSAYPFHVIIIMLTWVYTDEVNMSNISKEDLEKLSGVAQDFQLDPLYDRCVSALKDKYKEYEGKECIEGKEIIEVQNSVCNEDITSKGSKTITENIDEHLIIFEPTIVSEKKEQIDIEPQDKPNIENENDGDDLESQVEENDNDSTIQPAESKNKIYPCLICEKSFLKRSHLRDHVLIHTGIKMFTCDICGKSFNRLSSLKRHGNVHLQNKDYKCDICDKSFVTFSTLSKHKKIHSGDKKHICQICSKSFFESSNLARHARTHTGEKPYSCSDCSQSFSDSSALMRHRNIHSEEKEFCCHYCNKFFHTNRQLEKHLKSCDDNNTPASQILFIHS